MSVLIHTMVQVLYEYDYYTTIYGFTMALHRWLLYEDGDKNRPLRNWVSVCALILIIEILLGFYIWVKPKNRMKRLAIKRKAKFRVLMYQLHTVLGVYFLIPLILIAYTGMAFNWKTQTKAVLDFVMQGTVEDRPKPQAVIPPLADTPFKFKKRLITHKLYFLRVSYLEFIYRKSQLITLALE